MQTYSLIDTGSYQRLEQWGPYTIIRPEPTASWLREAVAQWQAADAVFIGTTVQNGTWQQTKPLPESWPITLGDWQFLAGLSSSKHLGVFPEQLEQWQLLSSLITQHKAEFAEPIRFLNLFAHTGAASIAAASAGALPTHVDSSAPAIGRAKENQALNKLGERSIRWIREDVLSFVQRELRRGNRYDLIALDPPAYGHGAKGERFTLKKDLPLLLQEVKNLLSENALGVFITVYTDDITPEELAAGCRQVFTTAIVTAKPLVLTQIANNRELTTGCWAYIQMR